MADFVPYTQRETYQLLNIPPAVMRNIERRSTRRAMSYADTVALILATKYDIPFAPSPRARANVERNRNSITLRLPAEVMAAVRTEAELERTTFRSVILNRLADAFGLKRPPATHVEPGSRPGRRKGQ